MPTNNSLNNNSSTDFSSPNFISGYNTAVTSGGTTTLISNSNELQYFTGSANQTVVLPLTSTLVLGQSFTIVNNSTGIITVQSSGTNIISQISSNNQLVFICILTSGTTPSSWSVQSFNNLINIPGGAANQVAYQTAPSTTGFITTANNSVLTTDWVGVPSMTTTISTFATPGDGSTIAALNKFVSIGTAVATATSPQGITSYTISGTPYISICNYGSTSFSTYSWNGSAFVSIGSAVATGSAPWSITSYTISGTPYISLTNFGSATFSTYSWNGSAFVSIGSAVATGSNPKGITSYTISGTQYISICNYGSSTFSTYSWNGSTFVLVGSAVATGSNPNEITSYTISGTQYVSLTNYIDFTFSTYSWNGSAFVSIGTAVATGSNPIGITSYTISGTQYISICNTGSSTFSTYSWNGSTFVSIGSAVATGGGVEYITSYTVNGTQYISVANNAGSSFGTYSWNGSAFASIGSGVITASTPFGITSYTINNIPYLSITNRTPHTFGTYSFSSSVIATGNFNGGLITSPVSSSTATSAFGSSLTFGTAIQNTTGYNILVNIAVLSSTSTTAVIQLGVSPTASPSLNTVVPTFTGGGFKVHSFSAIVPNNYYLLVNNTGTITVTSTTLVCSPI